MALPIVEAAIADCQHAHRELLRVVDSLSDDGWARPVPYGEWSVKDLVAHVVGDQSPSGPGLILAGVLTPEFIAETSETWDRRPRNASMVAQRADLPREDLRQLLFTSHDAMFAAARRLNESHLPVLAYTVPMGPKYELRVEDWLWYGYHDRAHADDLRRALETDYKPDTLTFPPEIEATFRLMWRYREGLLRAAYSVADDAWGEPSALPGWSYRDILAHMAINDRRPRTRLRAVLGDRDEAELEALMDTDGWNQRTVEERRGRSVRQLVDEMVANRYETLRVLSRFRSEHLSLPVVMSHGDTASVVEYIGGFTRHDAVHAGQLVPASSARRWKAA